MADYEPLTPLYRGATASDMFEVGWRPWRLRTTRSSAGGHFGIFGRFLVNPQQKMLYLGAQKEFGDHVWYVSAQFDPYKSIAVEIESIGKLQNQF